MPGRKTILSLCILSALIVSAIAAQSAFAVSGTTVQTCVPDINVSAGFKAAHCTPGDAVAVNRAYKHVAVAQDTATEVRGTAIDTTGASVTSIFKATISGITVEIQSPLAHYQNATLTNRLDVSGEHYFESEGELTFTSPIVTAPAGKGCKIKEADLTTKKIRKTSKGQGDSVRSEPSSGTVFAEFEIEGCGPTEAIKALNGNYQVTGSATCVPNGATLDCNEPQITEKNTLKLRGQKAGLQASFTIEGKDPGIGGDVFKPLSVTTVVT